ncbi:MAG: HD domain-containing phosphohydrolase [Treponemataceae bacterium]
MPQSNKVPDIIRAINETDDEGAILKFENLLLCMFASPVLAFGSITNLVLNSLVLNRISTGNIIDSLTLFSIALFFEVYARKAQNEKLKGHVFTILFSVILVYLVVRFYREIGDSVWTISACLVFLSILRTRKTMLFTMVATIFLTAVYAWPDLGKYNHGVAYYFCQTVSFLVFLLITAAVHQIIRNRFSKIKSQYKNVLSTETRLYLTLSSIGDGVVTVDNNEIIDFMNPIAEDLTGWSAQEACGKSFETVFKLIDERTSKKSESPIGNVLRRKERTELTNHTILIARGGNQRSIENTTAPITCQNGAVTGAVLVFRDYTERKEKLREIEYLSFHDQLTGLYNRRFFEEELKRLDTGRNLPFSIMLADINGLKTINDAFGHQYGDTLIQSVAEAFKSTCRADDIISRTGGDEFVILLPRTEREYADKLSDRVKRSIETRTVMNIGISISIGCATKTAENQPAKEVMKRAEDAMYQKKIFNHSSKRSAVIKSILNTLLIKSPREDAHSKRVSVICEAFARAYNLSDDETKELGIAGELHDIGKIAVDEVILNKPGSLSESELDQIRRHPETGYRILGTSSEFYKIAEFVHAHHERWDGKGYPKGLKGNDIHWKARIISIADSYDAMTCERPYRNPFSGIEALEEIKKHAGTQFDPDLVKIFVDQIAEKIELA